VPILKRENYSSLWPHFPIEIRIKIPDAIARRSRITLANMPGVASKIVIAPVKIRYTARKIIPRIFTAHIKPSIFLG
jgi:hypothetical protein